ncbi:MAG: hypothetical protein CMJ89_04390 [Planctomycetes bacterium]|nr:hypothetical protein [Planctomycetota bacterium]
MKPNLNCFAWTAAFSVILAAQSTGQNLSTELFAQGFARPVHLTAPPGDTSRVFVCEQHTGRVEIVELPSGNILSTPFVDVAVATGNEQGLLSMAFHPDYASNGLFYISRNQGGGATRVTEHQVTANPNVGSATVLRTIVAWNQPFTNHNGGQIAFGPDGYLYVGLGDGGSANDPGNRAQNGNDLLGKMLRLDVDTASPFIPASNPFVGNPSVRDEIWALGLRNPWRFSFDRATGDMWIADVGQNAREEIDFQPASSTGGENYGWRCLEGNRCTGLSGCSCADTSLTGPIHEYNHGAGCSVTGGFVYRGSSIPSLQGTYFFADYCSNTIWSLEYDGSSVSNFVNRTSELDPAGSASITLITSFGEDAAGELYVLEQGGQIWRITGDPACPAPPSATGRSGNNPNVYFTTLPSLGQDITFSAISTDYNFATLLAYRGAGDITLANGQSLLIDLTSPFVFSATLPGLPLASLIQTVPTNLALCGTNVSTQVVLVGPNTMGLPGFQLTNAVDLMPGSP